MKVLTNDTTDLAFINIRIRYKCDKYIKFKATLINKHNGLVCETKNYKINIKAWKRLKYDRTNLGV